jgi:AcrR family transcriptional regulator
MRGGHVPTVATRSRKDPAVRRQEILDAVIALGTDQGLDKIKVRDVADHVGVAPGLIHHYFPSTDELLAESFGQWADATLEQLNGLHEEVPPRVALALLVADVTPRQRLWNDALTTSTRHDRLRQRARDLSEAYLAQVEAMIQAGIDDGTFTCAAPRESAWRIILMLDGLVAMVHILNVIRLPEVATLVGPVVEHELGLEPRSFTELVQAVLAAEIPGLAQRRADPTESGHR